MRTPHLTPARPGPAAEPDLSAARARRRWLRPLGALLVVLALVLAGVTAFRSNPERQTASPFSDRQLLGAVWQKYTEAYIEPGSGRVLDRQSGDITTSEGQSYAMLRAVWQDDRTTFDKVWGFTRTALNRSSDSLLAWKYGQRPDGTYGVLTDQGGGNTASDADSDIALALVMAYGRWQQSSYLQQAQPIIADIWRQEVVTVAGTPVMTADNQEKAAAQVMVNPSYLSPYAYRVFARVDTGHDWNALVGSSYDLIQRAVEGPLDRGDTVGLPPNWLKLDRRTGDIVPLPADLSTDFGYDALRLPFRLALDATWNDEPRAVKALQGMSFLKDQWRKDGKLAATYAHDGTGAAGYESPAMYGGALGYFAVADQQDRNAVYATKLAALYDPDTQAWRTPLGYYDDNWAWFGMALYQGALTDLTRGVHS